MSIKFIHLERDNHIDHLECAECGASLKHAMQINGKIYGMDCGAKQMGWPSRSKAAINRKVLLMERDADYFRRVMAHPQTTLENKRYAAGRVCESYGLKLKWSDPDFLDKVLAAVS